MAMAYEPKLANGRWTIYQTVNGVGSRVASTPDFATQAEADAWVKANPSVPVTPLSGTSRARLVDGRYLMYGNNGVRLANSPDFSTQAEADAWVRANPTLCGDVDVEAELLRAGWVRDINGMFVCGVGFTHNVGHHTVVQDGVTRTMHQAWEMEKLRPKPGLWIDDLAAEVRVGQPTRFVVAAYDSKDSVVVNHEGPVEFHCSDPKAVLPSPYTFTVNDQGAREFVVTFNTPGVHALRVRGLPAVEYTQGNIVVTQAPVQAVIPKDTERATPPMRG